MRVNVKVKGNYNYNHFLSHCRPEDYMITEAVLLEEPETLRESTTTQTLEEMKEDMEMLGMVSFWFTLVKTSIKKNESSFNQSKFYCNIWGNWSHSHAKCRDNAKHCK